MTKETQLVLFAAAFIGLPFFVAFIRNLLINLPKYDDSGYHSADASYWSDGQ